ncbi:hypothetical protein BN59_03620 [Legionella massiliensis]|uniref:Uncharacterized protein n=1 Tax=Legionella massiliensis TaxID=1034943 RepID=A0A078L242_9GAMM|nr:hypothetical protein [Legionella massiliensis]CDZ79302.1 hypothetical protein BN59_03620 [Legionella massiliensis]CEE15040.1 hypothetical protein BN1094_03620 [Legionella massiliensis]
MVGERRETKSLFLLEGCCVNQLVQRPFSPSLLKDWIQFYTPMLKQFAKRNPSGTIIISEPRLFRDDDNNVCKQYNVLRKQFLSELKKQLDIDSTIELCDPFESKHMARIHRLTPKVEKFYNRNFVVFYNWSSEAQFRPKNQKLYEDRMRKNKKTDVSMLLGLKIEDKGDIFFTDPNKRECPFLWTSKSHKKNAPPQLPLKNPNDFKNYRVLVNIVSKLNSFTLAKKGWLYRNTLVGEDQYSIKKDEHGRTINETAAIKLLFQLKIQLCKFYPRAQVNDYFRLYLRENRPISKLMETLSSDKKYQLDNTPPSEGTNSDESEKYYINCFKQEYIKQVNADALGCFSFFRRSRIDINYVNLATIIKHAKNGGGRTLSVLERLGYIENGEVLVEIQNIVQDSKIGDTVNSTLSPWERFQSFIK